MNEKDYDLIGAYENKTVYICHKTETLKIKFGEEQEKEIALDDLIRPRTYKITSVVHERDETDIDKIAKEMKRKVELGAFES